MDLDVNCLKGHLHAAAAHSLHDALPISFATAAGAAVFAACVAGGYDSAASFALLEASGFLVLPAHAQLQVLDGNSNGMHTELAG